MCIWKAKPNARDPHGNTRRTAVRPPLECHAIALVADGIHQVFDPVRGNTSTSNRIRALGARAGKALQTLYLLRVAMRATCATSSFCM